MLQPIVIGSSNRLISIENEIDCQHIEFSFNVNMNTEHRTVAMSIFYRNDCKLVFHEFLPNFQPLRISLSTLWLNRIHWLTCFMLNILRVHCANDDEENWKIIIYTFNWIISVFSSPVGISTKIEIGIFSHE